MIGGLRKRHTEATNASQLSSKPLLMSFQQLCLTECNIIDYFWVALCIVYELYTHYKVHENLIQYKKST